MDIQEQLAQLRRTVAKIDYKYSEIPAPSTTKAPLLEEIIRGEVVETEFGSHFETEKLYARHQHHGSYWIGDLADLEPDLLDALSDGAIPNAHPTRWAFLDTETTGLAGGSGTYAFLVGVGSIGDEGFRVRHFFMRDYNEEASMLASLSAHLARFDVLITYNGRSYDQPLLETRYTMCRARHPFSRLEHLDLLYGARRLFRARLENCRLVKLENEILGVERHGDVPGEMIPWYYFDYLRTRRAARIQQVFQHNSVDIVSLACLTGLIPEAFRDPANMHARHGLDLLGVANWLQVSGRREEAHRLLRRAVEMGLPDAHLFRTLFAVGTLEKKLGLYDKAIATFTDLSLSPNPLRARAYEELAMHYEHKERNLDMALECVRAARALEDSEALAHRQNRLEQKRGGRQSRLRLRTGLN
jgi:uncharacterized protein YprB with RNaseH-like and TPR domain